MKLQNLDKWFTLTANVGVIAGLVLVALELDQTTKAIEGATYQTKAASSAAWNTTLAESEYGLAALFKGQETNFKGLDQTQLARVDLYLQAGFQRMDAFFYQYELGLMPANYYETVFTADMQNWVPRWKQRGWLNEGAEDSYIQRAMRPSFRAEIMKFIDVPLQDGPRPE